MSSQTIEKKTYPSQLNSKTISARIPVQDYVKFLQEALEKNISLNDWLLLKIYRENSEKIDGINIDENDDDVVRIHIDNVKIRGQEFIDFFKEDFEGNYLTLYRTDILQYLDDYKYYREQYRIRKQASLSDVKDQLTILIKEKFEIIKDQKDYRKELFELLKELE